MGFPRQEYWSGLPFPSPGDLPDPGIEPRSPALQADTLPSEPRGKPQKAEVGMKSCPENLRSSDAPSQPCGGRTHCGDARDASSAETVQCPRGFICYLVRGTEREGAPPFPAQWLSMLTTSTHLPRCNGQLCGEELVSPSCSANVPSLVVKPCPVAGRSALPTHLCLLSVSFMPCTLKGWEE